jgi:hypothetical protein
MFTLEKKKKYRKKQLPSNFFAASSASIFSSGILLKTKSRGVKRALKKKDTIEQIDMNKKHTHNPF